MREKIIAYLTETYHPLSVLLCGSYADGLQDECSDFDCMVIVQEKDRRHDDTVICGVPLDCFIFTKEETEGEDLDPFLTVCDAEIVLDDGTGKALKERVRRYVAEHSVIEEEEKRFIASWIRKTMKRARKKDEEGAYRAVAFLAESLCDYCFLRDEFYFGSKKTVQLLKSTDETGYKLYHEAIMTRTTESIVLWADYVCGNLGA